LEETEICIHSINYAMDKTLDFLARSFAAFEKLIYISALINNRQEYISKETLTVERTKVASPSNGKFFILFL
jgi:hypothetical protein